MLQLIKDSRLNNKAFSAVEIIICFCLVSVISIALFNTIMSYKDRQEKESAKVEILTYKNTITKAIQDDITRYNLKNVTINTPTYGETCMGSGDSNVLNEISCVFSFILTDETRTLKVNRLEGYIEYNGDGNTIKYKLPDLGTVKKEKVGQFTCNNIKSLRISNMDMKTEDNFFTLDVNFYHHDFSIENRYGIHIIAPMNLT